MEPDYRKIAETLVISDEAPQAGCLFRECCSLADSGRFDEAIELAKSIADTNFRLQDVFRNDALTYVTARCAEAGGIDRALEISEEIPDGSRSGALFWIALACDRYGQRERALQIATSISNDDVQKDALAKLKKTRVEHASAVGQRYFYGGPGRKNYRKAFPYLLKAAQSGEAHPQNLVGYCYDLGLGVAKDIVQAVFWYKRAAKQHHKEALCNLALKYERGEGVEANLRKAFTLYKRAALLGDAWAQCNLGVCYLEGNGTKQNLAEGIAWMRRAARNGDDKAQFNLGRAYLEGEGVRKTSGWLASGLVKPRSKITDGLFDCYDERSK